MKNPNVTIYRTAGLNYPYEGTPYVFRIYCGIYIIGGVSNLLGGIFGDYLTLRIRGGKF
jgi:hypothetical protein